MVTSGPARLLNLPDYGIRPGNPADLVVLDCETPSGAVAEIAQPLFGLKAGRRTFDRPAYAAYERAVPGDKLNGILDLTGSRIAGTTK